MGVHKHQYYIITAIPYNFYPLEKKLFVEILALFCREKGSIITENDDFGG
jgi:hypothetical protein